MRHFYNSVVQFSFAVFEVFADNRVKALGVMASKTIFTAEQIIIGVFQIVGAWFFLLIIYYVIVGQQYKVFDKIDFDKILDLTDHLFF